MSFTDNLYTKINCSNNKALILLSSEEHPIFKAHFPNMPLLPGFLQIDIACEIFNINIKKIKKAKFINIIKPKDEIEINITSKKIIFNTKDNKKISEIIYE